MIDQQTTRQRSSTLTILCILTIVGSVFIILKGLISYYALELSNDTRSSGTIAMINAVYLLELLSCIGTIIGAGIMLGGKKIGLTIYYVSAILYIVMTIAFSILCVLSIIGIVVGILQFFYLIPSVLFLVLYNIQRKHLS